MSRSEGDLDPVVANPFLPDVFSTPMTLVINSFVHHVPFFDLAFPVGNNLGDMILQNFNGFFPGVILTLKPPWILAVPSQGMATDHHPVLFRKGDNGIPGGKIIRGLTPTDGIPLHDILRHHGVELACKYLDVLRVIW